MRIKFDVIRTILNFPVIWISLEMISALKLRPFSSFYVFDTPPRGLTDERKNFQSDYCVNSRLEHFDKRLEFGH